MRRTLLLVLALPTVLALAGVASDARDTSDAALAREPALTVDAHGPVDTSDGAGPADPPGPSIGPERIPGTAPGTSPGTSLNSTAGSATGGQDDPSAPGPALRSPEGFLIAPGGDVTGSGPRWRYTVEVEPATGLDLDAVADEISRALTDPRSWVRTRTLERVDDPTLARIRLLVATPDTVDRLCGQVGLRTNGIFSCWNGRFAALNAWRWEVGARGFDDISVYRTYLINHEFGHGLGYGHIGCPSPGGPAPVMMQQSKALDGCAPNGWPYP